MSGFENTCDSDERVALGGLSKSIGFMLRLAQLRSFERFYGRFGHLDMKPGEFSILWVIQLNPGIRQGLLAETLRIKPAHMTKTIRRLEMSGHVARQVPEDDRRSVLLTLTASGQTFVNRTKKHFFGDNDYHENALTPAECDQLTKLLGKYCGFTVEERR
jgi:DNA-binding MarR family transcriptional regulator